MQQIICLADAPWQREPTRTQQLLMQLQDTEILFFEPPIAGNAHKKPGRKVRRGLTVYTLPPFLEVEERYRFLFRRGQNKLACFIEEKEARHHFRDPLLWACTPDVRHLANLLSCRGLVYDCARWWGEASTCWEDDLTRAADLVFAASPALAAKLSVCNDNVVLLPNGVNHPLFARENLSVPPALHDLRGPVLGYLGDIGCDLDLEPVLFAADHCPDGTFVLVGNHMDHPQLRELKARHNIRLLSGVPVAEQPAYLGRFDVCLNLLDARAAQGDIVPSCIYAYFCTGKPVVSMIFPEAVESFPDVVYGAHSLNEFSRLCARAFCESGDWARNRRRSYGASAAWSARGEAVSRILETIGLFADTP